MTIWAMATLDEGRQVIGDARSTLARNAAELACRRALAQCGYAGKLPRILNAGIVGYTYYGDRYPELWLASGKRLKPHQFSSSVLNSVIGHCTLEFGLIGPQILLTRGSPTEIAALQLSMGRSRLMLVCTHDQPAIVEVAILRRDEL